MDVRTMCVQALSTSECLFRRIEADVPPAQWVPWMERRNWRFIEQLPSQALLQKLARQLSGLRALDCLLLNGFIQEVGSMFRILDELAEDIMFIALGLSTGRWIDHHDKYLAYFWSELDDGQPPVQRKSIRAYINRAFDQPDPATADKVARSIHQAFSDFIHARSSSCMAMVSGPPARFDLGGSTAPQALAPFVEQMPAYFYRGLISVSMVARACASSEIFSAAYAAFKEFETNYGQAIFPKTA